MKSKLLFMLILVMSIGFMLTSCEKKFFKKQSMSSIIRQNNITKIEFVDGRGGINKPFILEDKDKIKTFLSCLDNYIIEEEKNHPASAGWSHAVNFYNNDKKLLSITFGDTIEINEVYYKVLKGGLNTKELDELIKSINPSWNIP